VRAALADRFASKFDALTHLTVVDGADTADLREQAADLQQYAAQVRPELEVRTYLGKSTLPEEAGSFDLAVISPGLAPHDPLTVSAQQRSDELISELEFAWRLAPATQQWIAITGSNGKTTTTMLCDHLLREAGRCSASVGNIGEPVTDLLREGPVPEILVVEASSFQLEYTTSFAPQAAALLNVSPDHLNWHGSLENYAAAKCKIFAHQHSGDVALTWDADPFAALARTAIKETGATSQAISLQASPPPSAYREGGQLWLYFDQDAAPQAICSAADLQIPGEHNICNALFAAALVAHFGVSPEQIAAGLKTFRAPTHRLELVATIAGVRYFDDSKATNPDSVRAALTAFGPGEAHLLLGGRGKGTSYEDLARIALAKVRGVYTFGEEGSLLAECFRTIQAQLGTRVPIRSCEAMVDALECAAHRALPSEAVLLSPACTSFDEFSSYEERGEVFAALVHEITSEDKDPASGAADEPGGRV